jgi:alkylation response protein AidB-like acyl-CoA dehydrogenase
MTAVQADDAGQRARDVDELLADLARVTPDLQANAEREDDIRQLSNETIECLDELGVFMSGAPSEFGGRAYSTQDQCAVYAAAGRISGSVGWVTWVTTSHHRIVGLFPRAAQDEVYDVDWRGPLVAGVFRETGPGRVRAVDGGWMVSGSWPFCSGSAHTAWFMLGAKRVDVDQPDPVLLLIPRADVQRLDDWHVSGLKATGSSTMLIEDEVFVPAHRSLSLISALLGIGADPPAGDLFRTDVTSFNGITATAAPVGMARGAYDYFTTRMHTRGITFTDYKLQAAAPVTHLQLAEVKQRIDLAELAVLTAAADIDRLAATGGELDMTTRAKYRFDLAWATRSAADAIDTLHRASGASTIHNSNPMQRYARDARTATLHGVANYETAAEDYGRALAGQPMFQPFG